MMNEPSRILPSGSSGIKLEKTVSLSYFAITSTERPQLTDALWLSERVRAALMSHSRFGNEPGQVSRVISGKNADGIPLRNDHGHAFIIPEDIDDDGFLERILVYSRDGFDTPALRAIGSIRKVWGEGHDDVYLELIGIGNLRDFVEDASADLRLLKPSEKWISATPYHMTRYPKVHRNGQPKLDSNGIWLDGPIDQIQKEIVRRGLPLPIEIRVMDSIGGNGRRIHAIEFASLRENGGPKPNFPGYCFELKFDRAISGPLSFGYGCHFGLGSFRGVS